MNLLVRRGVRTWFWLGIARFGQAITWFALSRLAGLGYREIREIMGADSQSLESATGRELN